MRPPGDREPYLFEPVPRPQSAKKRWRFGGRSNHESTDSSGISAKSPASRGSLVSEQCRDDAVETQRIENAIGRVSFRATIPPKNGRRNLAYSATKIDDRPGNLQDPLPLTMRRRSPTVSSQCGARLRWWPKCETTRRLECEVRRGSLRAGKSDAWSVLPSFQRGRFRGIRGSGSTHDGESDRAISERRRPH